jgi:hypothetical protein
MNQQLRMFHDMKKASYFAFSPVQIPATMVEYTYTVKKGKQI